jgi:hypothetical protein
MRNCIMIALVMRPSRAIFNSPEFKKFSSSLDRAMKDAAQAPELKCPACGNAMAKSIGDGRLGGYSCSGQLRCVGFKISVEELSDAAKYKAKVDECLVRRRSFEEMRQRNGATEHQAKEVHDSEFKAVRDRWLKMNGLTIDYIYSKANFTNSDGRRKSWMDFYQANTSHYCMTCRGYHKPTTEHPLCRLCRDAVHAPAPKDIFFDYRGWIFTPPFICMACGIEVCFRQWAFSRSCGSCDVSKSDTRLRLPMVDHPHYGRVQMCFAGPHKKSPKRKDRRDIVEAAFLPAKARGKYSLEMPKREALSI